MKEIEVPKELKKELQRFNLYCRATIDDKMIDWTYSYGDYGLELNWSDFTKLDEKNSIENFFDKIIENIEKEFENILHDETDCDNCTGDASLDIRYTPTTSTFEVSTQIFTQDSHYYEYSKSFEEISKLSRSWYNPNGFRLYEKLNDDDFIKSLIDENDGETDFEMNFDGYGDSGSIEDGNYSSNIENLGYEMLDLFASGFENNEGGNGTIYFDLEKKIMNLEYNQNYGDSFSGPNEEIKLV